MKKWNWSGAIFVMALCALGVLSNKNIEDATRLFFITQTIPLNNVKYN